MTNKKYRACIVGCGRIASLFAKDLKRNYITTHAQAYLNNRQIELIAACDLNKENLDAFGNSWGVKNLYTDFETMLQNERPSIVSICTWPATHYKLVKIAILNNVKSIFCEKPFTTNLKHADELCVLARKKKVNLFINHSRRWDEGHQKIKKIIHSGKIGEIKHVDCYYTAGIGNTGTHLIDLLTDYLGEAIWVYSNSSIPDSTASDPSLSGIIQFKNGAQATLHGLNVKDYLMFELDFYGTKGRIRLQNSGFDYEEWKIIASPHFSGYKALLSKKTNVLSHNKMLPNAVKNIVAVLDQRKKQSRCDAVAATRVLEIIGALKLSLKQKKRIDLPIKLRNMEVI